MDSLRQGAGKRATTVLSFGAKILQGEAMQETAEVDVTGRSSQISSAGLVADCESDVANNRFAPYVNAEGELQ